MFILVDAFSLPSDTKVVVLSKHDPVCDPLYLVVYCFMSPYSFKKSLAVMHHPHAIPVLVATPGYFKEYAAIAFTGGCGGQLTILFLEPQLVL